MVVVIVVVVVYVWDAFALCIAVFRFIKLDRAIARDLIKFHSFPDLANAYSLPVPFRVIYSCHLDILKRLKHILFRFRH